MSLGLADHPSLAPAGGTVVISQPMFFPWVGMLEQLRLADTYVHYDDVQFEKGSFSNRVQIKTQAGVKWLTVPLRDKKLGQRILDVQVDEQSGFRRKHLTTLRQAYAAAPFRDEMLACAERVYRVPTKWLCDLAMESMAALCEAFAVEPRRIERSSQLSIPGSSSARVLEVVRRFGGSRYVTGHGAQHYLDHDLFEHHGISVHYMAYQKQPYPQRHGDFTPFVSGLDLLANVGRAGRDVISSGAIPWQRFLASSSAERVQA